MAMTPLGMLNKEDAAAASPTRKGAPIGTFAVRDLSVLAYAHGFTLWHYKLGLKTVSNATAPGFFNESSDMMAVGDMILVSGSSGAGVLVVANVQNGVVVGGMG